MDLPDLSPSVYVPIATGLLVGLGVVWQQLLAAHRLRREDGIARWEKIDRWIERVEAGLGAIGEHSGKSTELMRLIFDLLTEIRRLLDQQKERGHG